MEDVVRSDSPAAAASPVDPPVDWEAKARRQARMGSAARSGPPAAAPPIGPRPLRGDRPAPPRRAAPAHAPRRPGSHCSQK